MSRRVIAAEKRAKRLTAKARGPVVEEVHFPPPELAAMLREAGVEDVTETVVCIPITRKTLQAIRAAAEQFTGNMERLATRLEQGFPVVPEVVETVVATPRVTPPAPQEQPASNPAPWSPPTRGKEIPEHWRGGSDGWGGNDGFPRRRWP